MVDRSLNLDTEALVAFVGTRDLVRAREFYVETLGHGAAGVEAIRYPWFEQSEDGAWTAPSGDLVAWFADPDGNVLSLTQLAVPL